MEFLHSTRSRSLADPLPMGVEPAPGTQPPVATDLDASHRVFPPLTLKPCYLRTSPRQDHPLVLRTGHMPHEEEVWGEKIFSYNLMAPCIASSRGVKMT